MEKIYSFDGEKRRSSLAQTSGHSRFLRTPDSFIFIQAAYTIVSSFNLVVKPLRRYKAVTSSAKAHEKAVYMRV